MQSPDYSISTPENVDLHLELAGLGNRILAAFIDMLIIWVVILSIGLSLILLALVLEHAGSVSLPRNTLLMVAAMIAIFVAFFLNFGYHIFFEGIWHGQTPGKRAAEIRVIEANGQPVGWAAVCIRNLIRVIDTSVLMIGLLVMLIDKNERRLGDLAAGTLVIRERKSDINTAEIKILTQAKADALLDVGRISPEEYDLLARFLKRRTTLSNTHRPEVAKKLETYFREKLGETGLQAAIPAESESEARQIAGVPESPEGFLEKVFLSYQARGQEA